MRCLLQLLTEHVFLSCTMASLLSSFLATLQSLRTFLSVPCLRSWRHLDQTLTTRKKGVTVTRIFCCVERIWISQVAASLHSTVTTLKRSFYYVCFTRTDEVP